MLIYLLPFLFLICLWLQSRKAVKGKAEKGKRKHMFLPAQFLVMRMGQRKARTLYSPWRLQLRYGITDNRPAEGKRSYHVSLANLCLQSIVKREG